MQQKLATIDTEETLEEYCSRIKHSIKTIENNGLIKEVPINFINQKFMLDKSMTIAINIDLPNMFKYEKTTKTKCGRVFLETFEVPGELKGENKVYTENEYMIIDETGLMYICKRLPTRTYPLVNTDTKPN